MTYPWYVHVLLADPDRVMAHVARMRARGVVEASPTPWQLSLGVLRMWHRVMFRTETVGTSAAPIRPSWRARVLHHRAIRLPFLLRAGAVIPYDFTGLRSEPGRLIDHLVGAHHDGNQFVFDLELLTGHGALDALAARVAAVLDGRDPHAAWLRDLAVFVGYHESLAAAVDAARAGGPGMTAAEATDPDLTLRGLVAWCVRQPETPAATLAAWQNARFQLDARPAVATPSSATLCAASGRELAGYLHAGHPIELARLAGAEYHGTSLGLPAWAERLTWKTFMKAFVADGRGVRGWNIRVDQRAPWTPQLRRGKPVTFGHFAAVQEGETTVLDYGAGGNRRIDPTSALRDPLVALEPGSVDRLLGVSLIDVAGVRLPTPAYFLLERGGPVRQVAVPARSPDRTFA